MNEKTGGRPGGQHARALAVLAAVVMLTSACGVVHVSFGSSGSAGPTTGSTTHKANLAFAHCMRTHGQPNFPDPGPSRGITSGQRVTGNSNSSVARAYHACEYLLAPASATTPATTSSPSTTATDCLGLRPPCYTPQQIRVAYGIQPLLNRGITGSGQTAVLLEFPPTGTGSSGAAAGIQVPASSDIRQDLADFDAVFGLPAARVQVVNTLAHTASPWQASPEEVADTDIVHAIAPDAAIREVLIPSSTSASPGRVAAAVLAALRLGLSQGGVIELSAGAREQCFTQAVIAQGNSVLQAAQRDGVTVVMSTSDYGAAATPCPGAESGAPAKGVDWPASDPLTLAVGGTSLQASQATGAYIGETAWNTPDAAPGPTSSAGGGGFSGLFPRPTYQDGIVGIGATRGEPDVSADADPGTGMALAISAGSRDHILIAAGGTSAAAPLWAAVIALADQYAGRHLGFVNPALYQIGRSPSYHQAFHDVTTGTNTVQIGGQTITGYQAAPGWDPVTGWGSPDGQALVPLLAHYASR
jgi:subtilase family serine protease